MAEETKNEVVENVKTEALKKFFKDNELEMFEVQELKDENETAIFRSRMEVKGQVLPFAILIDRSVYTLMQVQLATGVGSEENFNKIAALVNDLNNSYRMFKFNVAEDGSLLLNACFIAQDDKFDPILVRAVLDETLKLLDEQYPALMEKVWSLSK